MKSTDKRIVWKEKDDLSLLMLLNQVIEKYGIENIRQYQKFLNENPNESPSTWFISERFGSWDKLLLALGKKNYERYKWSTYSDSQLEKLVTDFITEKNIRSQRQYESKIHERNMPSLFTLKKRFEDVSLLFRGKKEKNVTDFETLTNLRAEIIRLKLENSLSRNEFTERYDKDLLPHPTTIMRRNNKSWEELMEEIGFDYYSIKKEKLTKNLKNQK
jgi:hypothetical protein